MNTVIVTSLSNYISGTVMLAEVYINYIHESTDYANWLYVTERFTPTMALLSQLIVSVSCILY